MFILSMKSLQQKYVDFYNYLSRKLQLGMNNNNTDRSLPQQHSLTLPEGIKVCLTANYAVNFVIELTYL